MKNFGTLRDLMESEAIKSRNFLGDILGSVLC